MKKVLFYYPEISGDNDNPSLYIGIPLSVMTLAAQIDSSKYDVKIIDGRVDKNIDEQLESWLDNELVLVGISAITSYQIKDGICFVNRIKKRFSNIKAVWGGWHPSLMPYETIKHPMVDVIILGQGEKVMVELIDALANHEEIDKIPNLLFEAADNQIIKTEYKFYDDLNSYQSITKSFKYVNIESYINKIWGNERVIGYESSRGCPWQCKYCSIGSLYKKSWNALIPETIVSDIKYIYDNHHIDAIHFFDNNFFINTDRVTKFCELLIAEDINIKWDGTCNVIQFLSFSDEFLEQLKDSGFYRVIIGIESGDEEVLQRIGKLHKNNQVLAVAEKCKKHGIQASFSFMVGFPWNPEQDFNCTIDLISRIQSFNRDTEIMLFIFTPYCGTAMYDIALQYGMKFPDNLEDWASYTYDKANTPWLSKQLRRKMKRYISFFDTKDLSDNLKVFTDGQNALSSRMGDVLGNEEY